jgi:hypothetical protein
MNSAIVEEHKERFERPVQDIKTNYAMDCYFHPKIFGDSKYFKKAPHRPFCQLCGEHCSVDIIRARGKCFVCLPRCIDNSSIVNK